MRNNTKLSFLGLLGFLGILGNSAFAQNDELNRSVTVERDFQPEIQAAGKIATKPEITETTIEPAEVEYSDYTVSVQPEATISPLLSQPTRFEPGQRYNGYIRGGIGHANTLFDLGYHLNDGNKSLLDVFAHHKAQWVEPLLSKTLLGLKYTHNYSTCDLYFGLKGGNIFYHKYGDFYSNSLPNNSTNLWTAEAFIGVKSNAKQDLQYKVQTGYKLFTKPNAVSEHQVRTLAKFDWKSDVHYAGANLYVQNNFIQLSENLAATIPADSVNSRHAIRLEPYYEYKGTRIRVHVGVNLDMNIGSRINDGIGTKNFCFAPSPHINLEAQIAKNWLTFYADIVGNQGMVNLQHYMEENRYRLIHMGILEPHAGSYTPVDAELGFRIKPYRDLLIELHGGYAYMKEQDVWVAVMDSMYFTPLNVKMLAGEFSYYHDTYQRGKVGGQVNYHYRDFVRVHLQGDYYIWRGANTVYDRPNWELSLRVDGKIDEHWSVYSDNYFAGSRMAKAYSSLTNLYYDAKLDPTIELNLGVAYNMWVGRAKSNNKRIMMKNGEQILRPQSQPNLTLFAQLNNFIHRKNEIYLYHHSSGINCLIGATFRF